MNIYTGNLSRGVTEEDLRAAFEAFGQVSSVNIIKDRYTGESRGFGFIEMPLEEEARAAIQGMNGKQLKGRPVNVNEARSSRSGGNRGGRPGGGRPGRGRPGGGRFGGGRPGGGGRDRGNRYY